MPPRKRAVALSAGTPNGEPALKRRWARHRQAAAATLRPQKESDQVIQTRKEAAANKSRGQTVAKSNKTASSSGGSGQAAVKTTDIAITSHGNCTWHGDSDPDPDPDPDAVPTVNPDAPRHDGEWYWLMKAEPETRLENGVDVKFSIDHLRAKTRPEGWDGIRSYAARNHMRTMNAGDKAFFYHSNCKEPGIVGIMEIVKEFSEDVSARDPVSPYHDPKSTKENPRWSLVHVEFRKKFAMPITLKELRDLGSSGGPLENMQMLRQSRLSVSRVSKEEWEALCKMADEKAREAGLEHETAKAQVAGSEKTRITHA